MSIFSRQKERKELVLVFDIGSSSIGGAVFEVRKGIPKILISLREPIALEEKIDTDRFFLLALKALDVVASKICLLGIGRPAQIFAVLSSPWYASQTRVIKLEKNAPFSFTAKLADSLIKKEVKLLEEEHSASEKIKLIEFKNVKIELNGYATSAPLKQKAKKLEMTVFVSFSGEKLLKRIEEKISRHFYTESLKFCSFAMASFASVRDMFAKEEDFLLVDIAGEVTDISVIKKDILAGSVSYPLGRNFMLRKLAEALHSSLGEAKSYFSLYKDKHAIEAVEKKLEPTMRKLKKEWLQGFQNSLASLSDNFSVPSAVFVAVDQDLESFFEDIIKAEEFNQYILTDSKFKIVFLNSQTLHGTATFGENAERDPFLVLESIYLNRFIC